MPPCLTLNNVRYVSWVKLSNPLHFGVVAIEKGAFWSPSTTVAKFTLLFLIPGFLSENFHVALMRCHRQIFVCVFVRADVCVCVWERECERERERERESMCAFVSLSVCV